jgi:hypothetical protein
VKTASIERKLLSVDECNALTGLSAWWFRRAAYAGRIESVKVGSRLMIPVSEVDRVITEGTRPRVSTSAAA